MPSSPSPNWKIITLDSYWKGELVFFKSVDHASVKGHTGQEEVDTKFSGREDGAGRNWIKIHYTHIHPWSDRTRWKSAS